MKALRFFGSKDGVPEEFYGHVAVTCSNFVAEFGELSMSSGIEARKK
jgi:hypothetical protein